MGAVKGSLAHSTLRKAPLEPTNNIKIASIFMA